MSRYDRGSKADVKAVLSSAMGVLRDHGLRLDPQLTLALKAMAQSSAFFTPLALPDRPFTEAALEAVRDLAEQTFTEDFIVEAAKKRGGSCLPPAWPPLPRQDRRNSLRGLPWSRRRPGRRLPGPDAPAVPQGLARARCGGAPS